MKAAVLFSGGKDSTMAAYSAIKEGHEVEYLVSVFSDNPASYMFHVANIHITELSAEAMGIKLIKKVTKGIKEEELEDLKNILIELKDKGIEAIYSGALFSVYQKSRIDALCEELGLESCAPLWHRDPTEYMEEIIDLGFEVIITSVAAEGFDEPWLGRKVDRDSLLEIVELNKKYKIHIGFEGGEAETLVLDGPIFNKKIKVMESENIWEGDSGYFLIKEAELEEK
ncbi:MULTISPECIES: TIGR00289 family protein [Methanobacterium]|jgi:predicted ATP pyrophosphatase (TIGR00289 family)|uniref:TIGR00289 family protein n=1 Tax=Methanobacterium veterum TaxID=408577 RepID=A0A9E5A1B6_9EURY|nr:MULTISPECIES: TIGR00289 family protein [Methanobacterium]MCZ3367298.1 TIGR00289 family protein [Methanobacterium veterum]MCZ3373554.1 TIGR00289 family protein [Methanobacterium veterum]